MLMTVGGDIALVNSVLLLHTRMLLWRLATGSVLVKLCYASYC